MPRTWYSIKAKKKGKATTAEIAIYAEIGYFGITAQDFRNDLLALGEVSEITLAVNSPGGEVMDGWAIYNLLRSHSAKVIGRVDAMAASMASVILMACDEIHMYENSHMMIHRVSGGAWGDAEDMREYADLMEKLEQGIVAAYASRSGIEEDEIRSMMAKETWMDGNEAKEKGFADTVLDKVEATACVRWKSLFNQAPKALFDSSASRMSKPKTAKQKSAAAHFARCKKAAAEAAAAELEAKKLLDAANANNADGDDDESENNEDDDDTENEDDDDAENNADDDTENEGDDDESENNEDDDDTENEDDDDEASNAINKKMDARLKKLEAENKKLRNDYAKIRKGVVKSKSRGAPPVPGASNDGGKPDLSKLSPQQLINLGRQKIHGKS